MKGTWTASKNEFSFAPMRTVLPGKPQAKLHALCTALWEGKRLVVSYELHLFLSTSDANTNVM